MPYQSYHAVGRALTNATRFMQESLCDAVKPQGGKSQAHILKALVDAGIPTASHIGLTPHIIAMFGGFRIQGRTAEAVMKRSTSNSSAWSKSAGTRDGAAQRTRLDTDLNIRLTYQRTPRTEIQPWPNS